MRINPVARHLLTITLLLLTLFLSGCGWLGDYRRINLAEQHLARGADWLQQGDRIRAAQEFSAAAKLQPKDHVYARIGLAYASPPHPWPEASLPWLLLAIRANPRQPVVVYGALAIQYPKGRDWRLLAEALEEGAAQYPDHPEMLNLLGWTYAERGVRLDRAVQVLGRAVKLAPNQGAIVDSLGWAYYQQGDLKRAVTLLDRAARLSRDPEIYYHLARAYARQGRRQQAIESLHRALGISPRYQPALEELRRLSAG